MYNFNVFDKVIQWIKVSRVLTLSYATISGLNAKYKKSQLGSQAFIRKLPVLTPCYYTVTHINLGN